MLNSLLTVGLHNFFNDDDLSLFYLGDFNDKSLLALTDIIHSYESKTHKLGSLKSKIIYLMIEAFQNVIRYGSEYNIRKFFMIRRVIENYFISTANVIDDYKALKLKEKIDDLNRLDGEALKEKYKQTLINKEFSDKGGAGLGFIEILRKTKQNIEYDFEKIKDKSMLFYFQLKYIISDDVRCNVKRAKEIYNFLKTNNVLFFLKHEFDEYITEALLRVITMNSKQFDNRKQKLLFHLTVEVLQNLNLHAYEVNKKKEGIFFIQNEEDDFVVNTGNFINNTNIKELTSFLKILKRMSKQDLNNLYLEQLSSDIYDLNGGGGLGFIDIARESKDFSFKFAPINENYSLFTFSFML